MKKIFNNMGLKLLAFVVAAIIWFAIYLNMNPSVDGFVSVPVKVLNEEYILNQNKTYSFLDNRVVRVNYSVKSEYQTQIRQSDFEVYVDLKNLDNTDMVPVEIRQDSSVESYLWNVSVEPDVLHIALEDASRKEFEVKYDINGEISVGHSIGNVILSPNVVYVSGSNADIENIDKVSIEIPVNNNDEMFSGIASVNVIGKDGRLIAFNSLSLSAYEVNYSVVMNSQSTVELNTIVEGNIEDGYTYEEAIINPKTITVNGPRSVLNNLYTLDLPVIDLGGLTEDKEFIYMASDILPIGITSSTQYITVTVKINNSNVTNNGNGSATVIGPRVSDAGETISSTNISE